MRYLGYSDASYKDNVAAITSIILTDDFYINSITNVHTEISSSTEAEILGMLQSISYIVINCPDATSIDLLCDNASAVGQAINIIKNKRVPKRCKYKKWFSIFLQHAMKYTVNVHSIKGHQAELSPNRLCDMRARFQLVEYFDTQR